MLFLFVLIGLFHCICFFRCICLFGFYPLCTCEDAATQWAVGVEGDVVIAETGDQLLLYLAGDCAVHALMLIMIMR